MNNTNSNCSAASTGRDDRLRHLSPEAREAYARFKASGDPDALDTIVLAIVADYSPRPPDRPIQEFPPETRLMDDLGFDSLAITELVFFTEDLFGISITNEEILQVRTLGDLRGFVRQKVGDRTGL